MKKKQEPSLPFAELRRRAEEQLQGRKPAGEAPRTEVELARLVHELEVRQIELEMQNAELQQARRDAEAANVHFHAGLEHAMDVVVMIDARGTVLYASPALERVLGYAPAEWVGHCGFDWIHPEEVPDLMEFLSKQTSIPGPSPAREQRFRHKNGSWRHLELIGNNRLDDPAVRGYVINGRDVTERKQAEAALAAKEQLYRALFSLAPCGILLEDMDGTILEVNDSLCRTSGYAREEVVGRNVRLFAPAQEAAGVEAHLSALDSGQALAHEVVNINKDGSLRVVSLRERPLALPDGRQGILVVAEDITERKRAEEALRQSEEHYRSLVNNVNVGVYRNTPAEVGSSFQANPALARIHGCDSVEEFLATKMSDHYQNPADREVYLAELLRAGVLRNYELRLKRKDGTPIVASVTATAHRGPDGAVDWIDGVLEDITERKRAEEALRESEERMRFCLEAARMVTWDWHIPSDTSRSSGNLLAVTGEESAPFFDHFKTVRQTIHPDDLPRVDEAVRKTLLEDCPYDAEFRVRLSDGAFHWFQNKGQVIRNEHGQAVRMVGVAMDIDQRKQAEEERRRSEEQHRNILRTAMDGFCVVDRDGYIREVNESHCQMSGYSRAELLAMRVSDLEVDEPTPEDVALHMAQIAQEGRARFETRQRTKDGRILNVEVSVTSADAEGSLFFSFVRDITARKRAQEALRESRDLLEQRVQERTAELREVNAALQESERRTAALLNATHQPMLLLGLTGKILAANSAMEQRLGQQPGALVGADIHQLMPPDLDRSRRSRAEEVVSTGQAVRFEDERSGIQMDNYIYPVLDEQGKVTALTVFSMDITARKQAEEKLRASEAFLRAAFDNAPFEFWVRDQDEVCVMENAATIKHWGILLGKRPADAQVSPEALAIWQSNNRRALAGEVVQAEQELHEAGGSRWIYNVIAPFQVEGQMRGIVGFNLDITARKQAEEALCKSEEKYRRLHESMTDAFVSVSMDGQLQEWNRAYQEMLGYTEEELRRLTYVDLTPEKWHAMETRIVTEQILPQGYSRVYQKEYRRKDGTILPIELRTFLIRDEAAQPAAMWAIVRDITVRKRAENEIRQLNESLEQRVRERTTQLEAANVALHTSEEKYRLLVERTPVVAWITDQQGRTSYISPNVAQIYGYTAEEIGAAGDALWLNRIHAEDRARVEAAYQKIFAGQPYDVEYRIQRKDGAWIWFHDRAVSCVEKDGVKLACGVFSDITERKRAEEALRESADQHHKILRTAMDGFWVLNRDGNIREVNDAYCRMSGYSREELLSMSVSDVEVDEPTPADVARHMIQIVREGRARFESRHRTKDGRVLNVEVSATSADPEGNLFFSFLRDITANKQAEQALQESEDRLRFALETSHTGAWDLDLSDHTAERSLEHDRIFGYAELLPQWTYEMFLAHVLPEDRATVDEQFRYAVATRSGWNFECRIRRTDEQIRWIWAAGRQRSVAPGVAPRMGGIVQDITERKTAEATLRSREEHLRLGMEAGGMITWEVDVTTGDIRYSDNLPEFLRGEGIVPYCSATEVLDQIHPEDRDGVGQALKRAMEEGGPFEQEYRARMLDGTYRWILGRGRSFSEVSGHAPRVLGVSMDITERKQAEAALRESEQTYRALIDTTSTGYLILDMQGVVVDANAEYVRLSGHKTLPEILGRSVVEWTAVYDQQWNAGEVQKCLQTGQVRNLEVDYTGPNGRTTPVEINATVVQTAQGARVLSLCRDISARKRNAEALRASEERYRTLAEASPDSISVISGDGVYEYANSNHARWFGHPSEDISGRHLTDLWPQASANRLLKEIRQILQAGVPAAIERPSLLHPARWVEMRWVPLPRADDKASSLLVVMRDITERKQAEAALRENESLLRAFYDSPGALRGIIELVEDDFRLLSANAALALSYGQPLEKILNCPASRLGMPQETLQLWIQHFQKSRRRGQPVTFEHWDEGKPKVRCLLVTVCFLGPAPGGPPRFGLVAMDITERKQAEAILAQLPRRLFEVQETERHRVSRELHDGVNQLLSSIKLRLHTAEEALPRPNKEARASLERCRELTAQVLEETRRISHALRPQSLEDLGLSAACRGLCEDFQSRTGLPVQYNDATLTTRLPATTELHLFRIVQEALNNIAKHAAATRVRVTLVVRKNGLELKIEDTGCGFNPRAPRVHGPKAHGLGLINFQERAAVLEGTCEIKSAPGKGTKIRVLVPLNKQPSTSPVSSPGSSSQTKTSSHDT